MRFNTFFYLIRRNEISVALSLRFSSHNVAATTSECKLIYCFWEKYDDRNEKPNLLWNRVLNSFRKRAAADWSVPECDPQIIRFNTDTRVDIRNLKVPSIYIFRNLFLLQTHSNHSLAFHEDHSSVRKILLRSQSLISFFSFFVSVLITGNYCARRFFSIGFVIKIIWMQIDLILIKLAQAIRW